MTGAPLHSLRRNWHPEPASEAAAGWVLLQEKGELSEADQRRFADWLDEDDRHITAYEDALWALDAAARYAGEPDMLALRGAALAARGGGRRIWGWAGGIGVAAAAAAAITFWVMPIGELPVGTPTRVAEKTADPRVAGYRTGIGERSPTDRRTMLTQTST